MKPPIQQQLFSTETHAILRTLVGKLSTFQTNVLECFAVVYTLPFLRGALIHVPALAASGTFTVRHKLARAPIGMLVLDIKRAAGATGAIAVYRRASDTLNEREATYYASASFESLTLWVW